MIPAKVNKPTLVSIEHELGCTFEESETIREIYEIIQRKLEEWPTINPGGHVQQTNSEPVLVYQKGRLR